jgi:GT2 family glycosyltransferase
VRSRPMVVIMVINYNGLRWLARCLSSVQKTEYPNFEVCLIDNASEDDSVKYVRERFPSVKIIRNSRNVGFAEAYNKAIGQVDTEYVAILNNDTEILNPQWLNHLVRVANQECKVAAVATKMVSMEDHRLLESAGGMGIPYWRGFVDVGREEVDMGQYPDGFEPFAFCGGAALIKKSAFTEAGGFDEKFFLYLEDPDLSWRLRLLGWKVRYAPAAKVAHYLGGTTGGKDVTPLRLYYCHRNLLRAMIKNCGSSLGWALRNYSLFSFLMILGFFIYERRKALVVLKGIAWNIQNLQAAYASRLRIQNRRKVSEAEVLRRMYPSLTRVQPVEHASLRRILNVLFEYGNRRRFQAAIRNQIA